MLGHENIAASVRDVLRRTSQARRAGFGVLMGAFVALTLSAPALLMMSAPALAETGQQCDFPGDVNSDDELNLIDVLAIVTAIVSNSECSACCNVNGDLEVDLLDVLAVVQAIVNPNSCTCEHGEAAEYLLCPANNVEACVSCDASYVLSSDTPPICVAAQVLGCQDSSACNYNQQATVDSGACVYADDPCESCSGETDGSGTVIDSDDGSAGNGLDGCEGGDDDGLGSCTFDGASYLSIADSEDWSFGSGDFTVEAYIYQDGAYGGYEGIISQWPDNNYSLDNSWTLESVGTELWFCHIATDMTQHVCLGGGSLAAYQWQHVAATRSGNTLGIFIDGVLVASSSFTATLNNAGTDVTVGGYVAVDYALGAGGYWSGHISNVRVVKGSARYMEDFTPSSTPLTTVDNTTLLTCQSTTDATDAVISPSDVMANGNVLVTTEDPF